jgi:hypothetical protein
MSREEHKKHFENLELDTDATLSDVQNSYLRLKKLYSSNSQVMTPLAEEFSEKQKKEILKQIDESYAKLVQFLNEVGKTSPLAERGRPQGTEAAPPQKDSLSWSGLRLKQAREKLGIDLSKITQQTKIRAEVLRQLEEEKFDAFPEAAHLKRIIRSYASFLKLNSDEVADSYIQRYREMKKQSEKNSGR